MSTKLVFKDKEISSLLIYAIIIVSICIYTIPSIGDCQDEVTIGMDIIDCFEYKTADGDLIIGKYELVDLSSTPKDSTIKIIDILLIFNGLMENDSISFIYLTGDYHCRYLVRLFLEPPFNKDTLLWDCDGEAPFLKRMMIFSITNNLSHMACFEWKEIYQPTIHKSDRKTVLISLLGPNKYDTAKVIDDAYGPYFSSDGTELFVHRYIQDTLSTGWPVKYLIYDLLTDTLYNPLKNSQSWNPYRFKRGEPLYYLKFNKDKPGSNVYMLDDSLGEVQLSHFTEPPFPQQYSFVDDSLVFFFHEDLEKDLEEGKEELRNIPYDTLHTTQIVELSKDAQYGILLAMDTLDSYVYKDFYYVEVIDFGRQEFRYIDSVPSGHLSGVSIGDSSLWVLSENDNHWQLTGYKGNGEDKINIELGQDCDSWYQSSTEFTFAPRDTSLIINSGEFFFTPKDTTLINKGYTYYTNEGYYIVKPDSNGHWYPECSFPSHYQTEPQSIAVHTYNDLWDVYLTEGTSGYSFNIGPDPSWVYIEKLSRHDCELDTILVSRGAKHNLQVAPDRTFYYVKVDDITGNKNIWRYDPDGIETQLTDYQQPIWVKDLWLVGDSIYYIVQTDDLNIYPDRILTYKVIER